ncbi:uncharacterized protein LOC121873200 [Homarus americanus]|uniref:uncharacterized protein LOC121873200 n=1 Tax=Homarus americanus TaxID=6706 RepID=UPI001C489930|nr:uncharacterized protein LOC121873200 [Homarus americanus]
MRRPSPSLLLVTILLQAATTIRVERVVVPPVVLAGRRVKLECQYKEEGDKLYSLKWWRNDDQFYQFIPPDRKHFKVPGVTVNFTASYTLSAGSRGQEVVVLEPVDLEAAGVYKCEVMADVNFQTEFRQANMTVMYAPEGPPIITPGPKTDTSNITAGQLVVLNCYSSPASPPPVHTWYINGRHVEPSWVKSYSPVFSAGLAKTKTRLQFSATTQLVASGRALTVTCEATQRVPGVVKSMGTEGYLQVEEGGVGEPLPSYKKSAHLTLQPTQPPSFWDRIFSAGSSVHVCLYHHHSLLLLVIASAFLVPPALTIPC